MRFGSQAAARDDTDDSQEDGIAAAVGSFTHFVDDVRSKTTDRVVTLARAIVFASVIVAMAIAALMLLLVALVRTLDIALPRGVWLAHLVAAALSGVIGLLLWRRRTPRPVDEVANSAGG